MQRQNFMPTPSSPKVDPKVDVDEATDFVATSMGLIASFTKEAMKTSAMFAAAKGRREVTQEDLQLCLKYQARMFFQNMDEEDVEKNRIDFLKGVFMKGDDDNSNDSNATQESWCVQEEKIDLNECLRLACKVEKIAATWESYKPNSEIQTFIKEAIDASCRPNLYQSPTR